MDLSNAWLECVVDGRCSANLTLREIPCGAVPVWLEVPDELADHFVVTDLKVGIESQLVSTGAVPASLLARGAPRDELLLDPVGRRGTLTVSVTNLGAGPTPFMCRVVFSSHESRLARYRRARVAGLGVTRVSPLGSAVVVVQPSWSLVPDRLYVPSSLLEKVEVRSLEIFDFVDGVGATMIADVVSKNYLTLENLRNGGLFRVPRLDAVNKDRCFVVKFRNKTDSEVAITGAILGGEPLS